MRLNNKSILMFKMNGLINHHIQKKYNKFKKNFFFFNCKWFFRYTPILFIRRVVIIGEFTDIKLFQYQFI